MRTSLNSVHHMNQIPFKSPTGQSQQLPSIEQQKFMSSLRSLPDNYKRNDYVMDDKQRFALKQTGHIEEQSKNTTLITSSELQSIRDRIQPKNNGTILRSDASHEWAKRIQKQRDEKEQVKLQRFVVEEQERRKLDMLEQQYQESLNHNLIQQSNQKIFKMDPIVRQFEKAMMRTYFDQENEYLQQVKKNKEELQKLIEQDRLLVQQQLDVKQFEIERKKIIERREKLEQNTKQVQRQIKEAKEKMIKSYQQDMIDGKFIREQAAQFKNQQESNEQALKATQAQYKQQLLQQMDSKHETIVEEKQVDELERKKFQRYQEQQDQVKQLREARLREILNRRVQLQETAVQIKASQDEVKRLKEEQHRIKHLDDIALTAPNHPNKLRVRKQLQALKELEEKQKYTQAYHEEINKFRESVAQTKNLAIQSKQKDGAEIRQDFEKNLQKIETQQVNDQEQIYQQRKQVQKFQIQQYNEKRTKKQIEEIEKLNDGLKIRQLNEQRDKQFNDWAMEEVDRMAQQGYDVTRAEVMRNKLLQKHQ